MDTLVMDRAFGTERADKNKPDNDEPGKVDDGCGSRDQKDPIQTGQDRCHQQAHRDNASLYLPAKEPNVTLLLSGSLLALVGIRVGTWGSPAAAKKLGYCKTTLIGYLRKAANKVFTEMAGRLT